MRKPSRSMLIVIFGGGVAALAAVLAVRTTLVGSASNELGFAHYGRPSVDLARAADHLAEALRFATVATEASEEVLDAQRTWIISTYPAFHAVAERTIVGGGTLVYRWQGTNPSLAPIVLMAHQDVVAAQDASRWRYPPFSGTIAEGAVWGRGSIDDKSVLIALLEAAESLLEQGYHPERTMVFVFGHDEETSGSGARSAAAHLAAQGTRAHFVLDEGSLVIRDHPMTGGTVALIGVAEKGYATLRLAVRAAGGHSSAPPRTTAVATLARAVIALEEHPFARRYGGVTQAMLEALAPYAPLSGRVAIANAWLLRPWLKHRLGSSPQGSAMLQTTMAPTMLEGAAQENVLASQATATVNLRIVPGESVAQAVAHVQSALAELPVEVTLVGRPEEPSPVSSTESPGYRLVAGVAAELFAAPTAPTLVIGATDSRSMREVADDIYRFVPLALDVSQLEMLHGIDEHIGLADFERMIAFYQTVLARRDAHGDTQNSIGYVGR